MKHLKKMGTKEYLLDELRSFWVTFISIMAVDGYMLILQVYNGTWEEGLWVALLGAAARSAVKTILTMLFPKVFPVRVSKPA